MKSPTENTYETALDRDAAELQTALNDLIRVYQFRDRKRICYHDISVTQCYALETLVEQGPLTLGELAQSLYLDKSTTSRVVDSLERKGYLERRADDSDRRCRQIEATEGGYRLHADIKRDLIEEGKRLLQDLDPEVRQATAGLIARLAREAASRFSRIDGSCCPPPQGDKD